MGKKKKPSVLSQYRGYLTPAQAAKGIEAARRNGAKINFEVYPYTAVSTKLSTFIPKEALNEGAGKLPQKLKAQEWRHRCIGWLVILPLPALFAIVPCAGQARELRCAMFGRETMKRFS